MYQSPEGSKSNGGSIMAQLRPFFVLGIFILVFFLPPESFSQATSPTAVVKTLLDSIQTTRATNGTQDTVQIEKAKKTINAILAIQELSQRSLDSYWDKLTPAEKERFVQLLTQLLEEVAYPSAGQFFEDLQIRFHNEQVKQDKALIRTTVTHPKEGKIAIDYELRLHNGQWIIWDIFLDEVSLATNLYTQFQAILAENSFADLLRQMEEKLAEAKK